MCKVLYLCVCRGQNVSGGFYVLWALLVSVMWALGPAPAPLEQSASAPSH